ncbi:hypothetical protein [Streptomyces sp. NPDC086519]|uniref:hypothetical protein n=1 Tax=Streptomyces sp. NPDC086519 TaxID=3154863 RepID=UPI00344395A4
MTTPTTCTLDVQGATPHQEPRGDDYGDDRHRCGGDRRTVSWDWGGPPGTTVRY